MVPDLGYGKNLVHGDRVLHMCTVKPGRIGCYGDWDCIKTKGCFFGVFFGYLVNLVWVLTQQRSAIQILTISPPPPISVHEKDKFFMAYSSSFFDRKHVFVEKSVPGSIYFLTPNRQKLKSMTNKS